MAAFEVGRLADHEARAVFPLIRETMPRVGLRAWLSFVKRTSPPRADAPTGIMAVRRVGRPFPCGLFCYRVEPDLRHGRVLIAEHFVAIDLLDPAAVLEVLVRELEALGVRLGCAAVRGVVHGQQASLAGGLAAAGHALEASLFGRTLAGPDQGEACPGR
jgi:hypothetical protein